MKRAVRGLDHVVVMVDGLGMPGRSKAYHDVTYRNLGDGGIADHVSALRQLGDRYPYLDLSRVGIYGPSAGGQSAMGALLFHPEFYKAAVSAAGCHDNRMDKIWWNEQWMGWPIGEQYIASSNVENAHLLVGELLLILPEMDTNVDPSSTLQVVKALIEADKDFDFLMVTGPDHGIGGDFGLRKRHDLLVQHLLGDRRRDRPAPTASGGFDDEHRDRELRVVCRRERRERPGTEHRAEADHDRICRAESPSPRRSVPAR